MYKEQTIAVILPALNEEASIGGVVKSVRSLKNLDNTLIVDDIVVCDNGSDDATSQIASQAGARVIYESKRGYGRACLSAISILQQPNVVIFIDADRSVNVGETHLLLELIDQGADLVIGARVKQQSEYGSLTPQQRWGNALASYMIRKLWRHPVTDLGPFRAIRYDALCALEMSDQAFGWTVEMQVKAIQAGMKINEVSVSSIKRIGRSKISGTIKGTLAAGHGIISTIVKLWWQEKLNQSRVKKYISS